MSFLLKVKSKIIKNINWYIVLLGNAVVFYVSTQTIEIRNQIPPGFL